MAATDQSTQTPIHPPVKGFEPYPMREGEEYMNPAQQDHFRAILQAWKREL
ncbi:MAG: RNA polymerase-binding protein DksA, partial [Candidatus Macondimonas sp.]